MKALAPSLNYFCKSAVLNLLQLLRLEVFIYISGLKFCILSTSDLFRRPYIGTSDKIVTDPKQAIAIALSEAEKLPKSKK